jgi:hypothetical protein
MPTDTDRHDPPSFLGNVPKSWKRLIEQAAKATGYDIYVAEAQEPTTRGYVGVYHRDPGRDTGPFWAEFNRLQEELERVELPDDLPDWAR